MSLMDSEMAQMVGVYRPTDVEVEHVEASSRRRHDLQQK